MRNKPSSTKTVIENARKARAKESKWNKQVHSGKKQLQARKNVHKEIATADWGRIRLCMIGIFFLAVFLLLWVRAGFVTLSDSAQMFAQKARNQHYSTELVSGRRGSIFDRNGNILAHSVKSFSVSIRPKVVVNKEATVAHLSNILGLPKSKIEATLNSGTRFAWLKRSIDDKTAAMIRDAKIEGVNLIPEYDRIYPYREHAAQFLGFTNIDGIGLQGIELAYEERLKPHIEETETFIAADRRRFYIKGVVEQETLDGKDVHVTLDLNIQYIAEQALLKAMTEYEAKWGGALVIDVPTGEILAWAEVPLFNPNEFGRFNERVRRMRLAADALEPGSTFKPFLVAAALEENKVTTETTFFCENGKWKLHTVTINDVSKRGTLTVRQILQYSSNIGMAKIGIALTANTYWSYIIKLGFGEMVGLPFNESKGIVRDPSQWRTIDLANISFGQGISTTGVQLAKAFLTIAGDGTTKPLKIILNEQLPVQAPVRVYSEATVSKIKELMYGVIHEKGGTGRRALIEGVNAAGKTGTAQKSAVGGYGKERTASFVGFAPVENPRFLVLVIIDEPRKNVYGGVVASPIFKDIMGKTLAYAGLLNTPSVPESGPTPITDATATPQVSVENVHTNTDHMQTVDYAKVPDLRGLEVRKAIEILAFVSIIPRIEGTVKQGTVIKEQSPQPGSAWTEGENTQFTLWLLE